MRAVDLYERHETFTFKITGQTFDIEKAKEIIKRDNIQPEQAPVSDLAQLVSIMRVDTEYAMQSDLSTPVIAGMVKIGKEEGAILIDGNHRVFRARREKVESLPVYVLDFDQMKEIEL